MQLEPVLLTLAVFGCFSAAASAVYLANDLHDRTADRAHPSKCHRPIASGRVGTATAVGTALILAVAALGGAALLSLPVFVVVAAYLVLQVLYTFLLKHFALLDLFAIAAGFVLRVLAGAAVLAVVASTWILVVTFLLALLLATGKRLQELATVGRGSTTRRVLSVYTEPQLEQILTVLTPVLLVSYLLYTVQSAVTPLLAATFPIVLYGVLRYLQILREHQSADGPTELILRDTPLLITGVAYIVAVLLIFLYLV
jgi:4-hydroxybenzoate polyprenyltransferase